MFRFLHPAYFFLLIPLAVLVGFFVRTQLLRKRNIRRWGDPKTMEPLMPYVSYFRPQLKFYLQLLAMILLVVVLAQPQFGSKKEDIKKNGIEVVVALDVSNSMLAQDIVPNRLQKAKQILSQMIDRMEDDRMGLIVFAGDAYVQLPITADVGAAKLFLSSVNTGMVPFQGTAIGSAIDLSIKSFGEKKSKVGRAIILMTDGENHEDDAISAARLAQKSGIEIHVIGFGSPEGAPIPIGNSMSFKKDRDGNVVVSKLNEEMCLAIAEAGGGSYARADNTDAALRNLIRRLDTLSSEEFEETVFSQYNEQFQSFALIALILMMIEFFLFSRKNKWFNRIKIFDVKN